MAFTSDETRAILRLTGPILATQLAQVGMGTVDTLMSGYVSTEDLAAVAIGSAIWTPVWLFLAGVMVALSPAIAKVASSAHTNASGRIAQLLSSGMALGVIVGTVLAIITALAGYVMPSYIDDARTGLIARDYLYAIACAMPASGIFLAHRFHAEAVDQAHHVTRIMLLGLLINIPINAIFIYGWFGLPALGGVGCGIGSAIVVTLMTLALHWDSHRYRAEQSVRLARVAVLAQRCDIQSLARVGVPIGIAIFFEVSLFTAIALFLTDLGPVVVAGHQVALNVSSVTFMLPLSLGMALTVRVGHHIGRGHTNAARRCAWLGVRLNLALALINASVILLGREHIAALYSPDAEVVAIGAALLLYAALFQIPDAIQIAAAGALRAYEDTVMVMVITFIAYWIAGLGTGWTLAYLLAEPMGAAGFWSGLIAGLTTAAVALLLRLRQQSRKISNLAV